MPIKYVASTIFVTALMPTQASAHSNVIAGQDPVAAVLHFLGQPDHILTILAIGAGATLLSPRVRKAARAFIRRRRR